MAKLNIYDKTGKTVGEHTLAENIFGIEPNENVMHDAVVNYLANQRQGTFAAKSRGMVRGGGRKPFRQKGTGRARQGSIRAPHYVGGGVVFAKQPRDFSYKLPKKVRKLALKSAFSSKAKDEKIVLVDDLSIENISTKNMVENLNNLPSKDKKTLIIVMPEDKTVYLSARNIEKTKVLYPNTINTYQILNYDYLVISMDAMKKIEEVYGNE